MMSFLAPALLLVQEGTADLVSTTDWVSQTLVAVIIVSVFGLLALEKVHRVLVVIGAVSLMWTITYLTPYHLISFRGAQQSLDLNVLILLASMMAVVAVIKTTGVFEWSVARILTRAQGDVYRLLVLIACATALLSAFADNVTTVIFMTPMVLQMARAIGISPVALLLPMVMASNIGGTATLIGDPPNIMIGSGAGLTFLQFIENLSAPIVVMMIFVPWLSARFYKADFARARQASAAASVPLASPQILDPDLLRWSLWISAFIMLGFFTHGLTGMPTAVPATIGAGALLIAQDVLYLRKHKPTHDERVHGLLAVIEREIEWPTLSFFGFLFIAVGAAVQTGFIDTLAGGLTYVIHGGSAFFGLTGAGAMLFASLLILWVSGFLSAIIDNIPFVAVMIPIIHRLGPQIAAGADETVLWWALALGACLGGNGTAVGASANVTVIGMAEKDGVRISFREFTRVGSLVTAFTLMVSSAFLAMHVYLGERPTLYMWLAIIAVIAVVKGAKFASQAALRRAAADVR